MARMEMDYNLKNFLGLILKDPLVYFREVAKN